MNILAIGPHPDDIEYGCGGALLKFKKSGARIAMLVMTGGESGGSPAIRKKEQRASARMLEAEVYWGGCRDTEITVDRATIWKVERVLRKVQPDAVFVNYREDTHQDHRATAHIVVSATRHFRNVLFFEVPTSLNFMPGLFMDIGDVLEEKFGLLRAHRSQVMATKIRGRDGQMRLDIVESAKACAVFRGFQDRVKYAEGFVPLRFSLDGWLEGTRQRS